MYFLDPFMVQNNEKNPYRKSEFEECIIFVPRLTPKMTVTRMMISNLTGFIHENQAFHIKKIP